MEQTKIVKSFSEKSLFEIKNGGNVTSRVTWERLKQHLGDAIGLSSGEKIIGLVADDDGVHVRIGYKK